MPVDPSVQTALAQAQKKQAEPSMWDQFVKKLQKLKLIPGDQPDTPGATAEESAAAMRGPLARRKALTRTYSSDTGDQGGE